MDGKWGAFESESISEMDEMEDMLRAKTKSEG